jgi:phosphatidylglycerophosphate synthase
LPLWLAPNMITVFCLAFTIAATMSGYLIYGFNHEIADVGAWFPSLYIICFLFARIFDEVDGK